MEVNHMINIDGITKIYEGKNGRVTANDHVSFHVNRGEIVGLLGHNGAGKTTLVNQILGLTRPTSGEISILGQSVTRNPEQGRFLCSVQPQSQLSLGELSPMKAVTIMGQMRGGGERDVQKEAVRLFEALDIMEWVHKESNQLSGGVKRLTAFCMAVINSRQIIILDEPTNDVDPVRRRYLWSEIRKLTAQGKGVILVTHNVAEAEHVVDKLVILHNGKVFTSGTSREIRGETGDGLRFEFLPAGCFRDDMLPDWVCEVFPINERRAFTVQKELVGEAITWARAQIGVGSVYDYSFSETTLEDVYVRLTTERREAVRQWNS